MTAHTFIRIVCGATGTFITMLGILLVLVALRGVK
jgi:hypothetical protein